MSAESIDLDEIKTSLKKHLTENLIRIRGGSALEDRTPLITGGILDSVASIGLVSFIEERFGVVFEAHEIGVDCFDSVEDIARTIAGKLGEPA